jgi:hypothetical protein
MSPVRISPSPRAIVRYVLGDSASRVVPAAVPMPTVIVDTNVLGTDKPLAPAHMRRLLDAEDKALGVVTARTSEEKRIRRSLNEARAVPLLRVRRQKPDGRRSVLQQRSYGRSHDQCCGVVAWDETWMMAMTCASAGAFRSSARPPGSVTGLGLTARLARL